jgi:hypothetical protein
MNEIEWRDLDEVARFMGVTRSEAVRILVVCEAEGIRKCRAEDTSRKAGGVA